MAPKITVIGSTNVDFIMKMPRLPRLGETITDGVFNQTYGGKGANQAVAAARAGAQTTFITCLGQDDFADKIISNFNNDAMNVQWIERASEVATGTALVMIGDNGTNYLSVAPGSNLKLTTAQVDKAAASIADADMLIIQLEIPNETNYHILDMAEKQGKKVVLNYAPPSPFDKSYLKKVHVLVANETEAEYLVGHKVETEEEVERAAKSLQSMGSALIIITLGSKGAYVLTATESFFSPGFKVNAVDTTAAGDTFCGALSVGLTEGKNVKDAVKFAQAAAALAVTKLGAQPSVPHRKTIEDFLTTR